MDRKRPDLDTVCGDVCGIQAQVMAAAQIAFWARMHTLSAAVLHAALFERRILIKTSSMRRTLHILPSADFWIYINALKKSRVGALRRIMSKFGITQKDYDELNRAIVEALAAGPLTQRELTKQILPRVNKNVKAWMEKAWSAFKAALAEGLICYGPNRGSEVSFVRVAQWLPEHLLPQHRSLKKREVAETEAQQILYRRYLSAYGPATLQDFSKWSGISMQEARAAWETLKEELMEIDIEDQKGWILRKDYSAVADCHVERESVRLLPSFDPFLLAHAEKNHLVDSRCYKRVYRNAGWISPVVLLNGRVVGIWSHKRRADRVFLECEPFENFSKSIRTKIEEEAGSLARFLAIPFEIKFCK